MKFRTSQDLHMTLDILFPNKNEKNVLTSLIDGIFYI